MRIDDFWKVYTVLAFVFQFRPERLIFFCWDLFFVILVI